MSGSMTSFTRGENPLRADKLNQALSERVSRAGDTMTGMFTLWRDPVNPFDAATKQYADSAVQFGLSHIGGPFLPLAGGTLTGSLTLAADPTVALGAATKQYVDAHAGGSNPGGAVIATTPPAGSAGALWWDSIGGQLYVRYDDSNSLQWVAASNMEGLANAATKQDVAATQNNVGRNLLHNPLFNIAAAWCGAVDD